MSELVTLRSTAFCIRQNAKTLLFCFVLVLEDPGVSGDLS